MEEAVVDGVGMTGKYSLATISVIEGRVVGDNNDGLGKPAPKDEEPKAFTKGSLLNITESIVCDALSSAVKSELGIASVEVAGISILTLPGFSNEEEAVDWTLGTVIEILGLRVVLKLGSPVDEPKSDMTSAELLLSENENVAKEANTELEELARVRSVVSKVVENATGLAELVEEDDDVGPARPDDRYKGSLAFELERETLVKDAGFTVPDAPSIAEPGVKLAPVGNERLIIESDRVVEDVVTVYPSEMSVLIATLAAARSSPLKDWLGVEEKL